MRYNIIVCILIKLLLLIVIWGVKQKFATLICDPSFQCKKYPAMKYDRQVGPYLSHLNTQTYKKCEMVQCL
jgi:hypothetical protein